MLVRDANQGDFSDIERIHAEMGLDYKFPDLNSPLWFVKKVVEDKNGILGACFLRLTSETYLWLPKSLDPCAKMEAMMAMQPEVLQAAWAQGIDETEARIPEWMEQKFRKRLTQLGWSQDRPDWHPWSRQCDQR